MPWRYRADLDGVRAFAVYLVLAFHAKVDVIGSGFIGVDVFFVLSGFLITSVILAERMTSDGFRLGAFYARRVKRLLPGATTVILATCALQLLLMPTPSRLRLIDDARAATLFHLNWNYIADSNDYFQNAAQRSPFLHFWSLGIEEQFYVVFPVVICAVVAKARRTERSLAVVLGALFVASVAAQVVEAARDPIVAYYGSHARAYQLLAGALLALWTRWASRRTQSAGAGGPRSNWGAAAAGAGCGSLVALATQVVTVSESSRGLLATGATVIMLGGLASAPRAWLSRGLGAPLPRYLGQISYGTYLWHWPVMLAMDEVASTNSLVRLALVAMIATGLASLSFHVIESPVRALNLHRNLDWATAAAGVASVVALTAIVSPMLSADREPAIVAKDDEQRGFPDFDGLAWVSDPVPRGLPYADLVADEGDVGASCSDGSPESCVVVDGPAREPLVVLVGDSHAGMLTSAMRELAKEKGFRLSSNIRNKCAWILGIHNRTEPPRVTKPCRAMREEFYSKTLPRMDADLVILVQRARDGAETLVRDVVDDDADSYTGETFHQMLLRRIRSTLQLVRQAGSRALIVHSIFGTNGWEVSGFDPLDCLSRAETKGECAITPAVPPPLDSLYDSVATETPDVATAELREAYCPGGILCTPVEGRFVIWKDRSHLSAEYLTRVRAEVWDALELSSMVGPGAQ